MASLIASIIMVRSGLATEEIGKYELWLFIVSAVTVFWSSGLCNALLSWMPSRPHSEHDQLVGSIFWVLTGLSLFVAGVIVVFSRTFISFFTTVDLSSYVLMFAGWIVFSVPVVLTEIILYLRKSTFKLINYAHWSNLSLVAVFLAVAFFSPTLGHFVTALLVHTALRFLYLLTLIPGWGYVGMDKGVIRNLLIFSAPLVLNMLLGSAMDLIDGWFVSRFFEPSSFPVFRYGARELPFSSLLYSSLAAAMIPVIINTGVSQSGLKARATRLMHILFPASILLMVLSPFVFENLYNKTFRESAFIFNVYLLILTSRVLLPQVINFAYHQHKVVLWSAVAEVAANILLSYWWMHVFGIYGLVIATVVAYFVQKAILIFYNKKYNSIPFGAYVDVRYYLFYCAIAVSTVVGVHHFLL